MNCRVCGVTELDMMTDFQFYFLRTSFNLHHLLTVPISKCLSSSRLTNYQTLDGLNNKNLFLTILEPASATVVEFWGGIFSDL